MKTIKYVQYNKEYTILGDGWTKWALSHETRKIVKGDTRVIGNMLMYAADINISGLLFKCYHVYWSPVSKDLMYKSQTKEDWISKL